MTLENITIKLNVGSKKMENMTIKHQGAVSIIEPQRKRIDASFAIKFREDVVALVEQGQKKLVLNMTNVEFIDSSGLGAVVSIMKVIGGNQNLTLCYVKDSVLAVFKLTRMDKIFIILPNEEEAVARLQP
jgi:anti-sigma B factor antagonist